MKLVIHDTREANASFTKGQCEEHVLEDGWGHGRGLTRRISTNIPQLSQNPIIGCL